MATVLVSFIGTGSRSGGEYEAIQYLFENEANPRKASIFGSALLQHLKDNNRSVEKWLILGTEKSIWSELVKMFPSLFSDDQRELKDKAYESQRNFLEEQAVYCKSEKTYQSKILQENLDEWQKILTDNLMDTKVYCRLVGDASNQNSQNKIFDNLKEAINDNDSIVFDVTHGLRNQPIITSFVLMYLRYLKKIPIENIKFYYGSLDSDEASTGRVIELDFCNELMKATEAVAIYEQTGNYEQIGNNLNLSENFSMNTSILRFADEVNRSDRQTPKKIREDLKSGTLDSIQSTLKPILIEALDWTEKDSFAERLGNKAKISFDHKQYLKAIVLLWEAILVAGCKKYQIGNPDSKDARNDAEDALYKKLKTDDREVLRKIEWLRNSVAHSSPTKDGDVQRALNDECLFQALFEKGWELFKKLL